MDDEYESTFSALKVAVSHLEEGDQYSGLVDQAEQQLEETGELNDDTVGPFLEMLYDLYDHAKTGQYGNAHELRKSHEQVKAHAKETRESENPYLVKRGSAAKNRPSQKEVEEDQKAYEQGLEEDAYRRDVDAILGAMELLSEVIDDEDVTYERIQEEAEEYRQ